MISRRFYWTLRGTLQGTLESGSDLCRFQQKHNIVDRSHIANASALYARTQRSEAEGAAMGGGRALMANMAEPKHRNEVLTKFH